MTTLPAGFRSHVANIGVKDDTDDFVVVAADAASPTAAVFTKSRFAGPSVTLSRANVADGVARAVVVISKNANVATGPDGHADAIEIARSVAARLGCEPTEVVVTSTGVIGRRYPIERVRAGIAALPSSLTSDDADGPARGMMTTDTHPKVAEATVAGSAARVVGMAKGVGMIEPDMATHISLLFTDAELSSTALDACFRRVVDRTFNCVSVDSDTSTSDSSVIIASGAAGPVDPGQAVVDPSNQGHRKPRLSEDLRHRRSERETTEGQARLVAAHTSRPPPRQDIASHGMPGSLRSRNRLLNSCTLTTSPCRGDGRSASTTTSPSAQAISTTAPELWRPTGRASGPSALLPGPTTRTRCRAAP